VEDRYWKTWHNRQHDKFAIPVQAAAVGSCGQPHA
jgi:hypothetical protein